MAKRHTRLGAGRRTSSKDSAAVDMALHRRRKEAHIELLEADRHLTSEAAVFDVLVNGAMIGRWVETTTGRRYVTWTDGSEAETDDCDVNHPHKIKAAVRWSAPIPPPPPPQQSERSHRRLPGLRPLLDSEDE